MTFAALDSLVAAVPISLIGLAICCLFWIFLYFGYKVVSVLAVSKTYSSLTSLKRDEWDALAWFHAVISFSVTFLPMHLA